MTETFARPKAPWALRLLPPFPAVAQRILALVGQQNVTARQVGDLIKLDPSFSAELLRLANSALFGARREVTSLGQAVMMLGMDQVKSMATFVAVNNMVRSSLRIQGLRKVWMHSLVTALVAHEVARAARIDQDAAYTAGLLHNLGTLGLMAAYPDEYTRMLEVSNDFGYNLLQTERDLFEIDHCAAGAYVAKDWNFPDELAAAIGTHHDTPVREEHSLENVVKLSWRIADSLGYAAFSPEKDWAFGELVEFLPNGASSWLGGSAELAKTELHARLVAAHL